MNSKKYNLEQKKLNEAIKLIEIQKKELRLRYIEFNKPCNIGDEIEIILYSGRKVKGTCVQFGILSDKQVYVTCYKDKTNKYISTPYKSLTKI